MTMTHLVDNAGAFVRAEQVSGKTRAKIAVGQVSMGNIITLRGYDTRAQAYVDTQYRVTGLGQAWQDRGYRIDSEDARSFGGHGESIRVAGQGQVQYAYLEVTRR